MRRFVGPFLPRRERIEQRDGRFTNCYIKNFGDFLDEQKLTALFALFGSIVSAKVVLDAAGKSKGFGFVDFRDPAAAETAVAALNGSEIDAKCTLLPSDDRRNTLIEAALDGVAGLGAVRSRADSGDSPQVTVTEGGLQHDRDIAFSSVAR